VLVQAELIKISTNGFESLQNLQMLDHAFPVGELSPALDQRADGALLIRRVHDRLLHSVTKI
jgi:hypothetical protein